MAITDNKQEQPEPVLVNIQKIVPMDKLRTMRSLDEIHEYLPAQVAGLTVKTYDGPDRDLLKSRTSVVRFVSNTPAMGAIAKRYSPFAIWRLFKERFSKAEKSGYTKELQDWEGVSDTGEVTQKGRGHTNPFQLLDQMLLMGPTGDEFKQGPAPVSWPVHYRAVSKVTDSLRAAGISQLQASHMVLSTEDSRGDGVPFAMLAKKSAAMPATLDDSKKPNKGNHLRSAVNKARRILVPGFRGLLFWPGLVFKRYDRGAPIAFYEDTEAARSKIVEFAKDRAIIAQPFPHQVTEGTVLRPVQRAIQMSSVEEIDVRTQYHTSLMFQDMVNAVSTPGKEMVRFTIGADESGWDHHMTPQGWYAAWEVVRSLYPDTLRIGWIECDEFVIFDKEAQRKLEEIAVGNTSEIEVRTRVTKSDGTVETHICVAKAGMEEIDTDSYLRRIFATASGNDILIGDIQLTGYKHVLDTPNHGKIQLGFGMRSGNWGTFLVNSIVNWYKSFLFEQIVKDPASRAQFSKMFGYELPRVLKFIKRLFRGDDSAFVLEVDPDYVRNGQPISVLIADLIKFTGGKANAKKQETSDLPGRALFGFAQVFVSEDYPTGVSGISRVMERMINREEDEATGIDPTSGEDLRHLIGDLGNWARHLALYDAFGKTAHPLRETVAGIWQDLDIPDRGFERRMLPPRDPIERQKLSNLFYSRLLRRGQAPPDSEKLVNIWNTDLGPFLEERITNDTKLSGSWNPISKNPPEDARPQWRPRIKS